MGLSRHTSIFRNKDSATLLHQKGSSHIIDTRTLKLKRVAKRLKRRRNISRIFKNPTRWYVRHSITKPTNLVYKGSIVNQDEFSLIGNYHRGVMLNSLSSFFLTSAQCVVVSSRIKIFMVARLKRLGVKIKHIENAWSYIGTRAFIFKKGQNSRMGKGTGSFFSTRRLIRGGSTLFIATSLRACLLQRFTRYIRARFSGLVLAFLRRIDLNGAVSTIFHNSNSLLRTFDYKNNLFRTRWRFRAKKRRVSLKSLRRRLRKKKRIHTWYNT
jgi:hypothetical protein